MWLNVPLILFQFRKVTFCLFVCLLLLYTVTINACFTSWLSRCALFSRTSFWRHQSVLWWKARSSQFSVQVPEEMRVDSNKFCYRLIYLYGVNFWWCVERSRKKNNKKVSPREKVWSIEFYSNLFLTRNDWWFWSKISHQKKKKNKIMKHTNN